MLLVVGTMFGMFFFLTQYMQGVLGFSPLAAGLAFLPLTGLLFTSSRSCRGWSAGSTAAS